MSTRYELIEELRALVNTRSGATFTHEQVEHYIGSDMTDSKLEQWVADTYDYSAPVEARDIEDMIIDMYAE